MNRSVSLLTVLLFTSISGFGQLKFFNDGHRPIRVAIGYYDDYCSCWKTAGWYKVNPEETKTVLNRIEEGRNYYYYSTIDGCNSHFSGEQPLIVDKQNAFDIAYADQASTKTQSTNYIIRDFHKISPESDQAFTLHLTQHNLLCNGKRDGEWEITYDRDWEITDDPRYIEYKRHINYENGKPKGWVQDFYGTGELQWEGKLLAADPDVVHGTATWYYKSGLKQQECKYHQGKLTEPCEEWTETGTNIHYSIQYGSQIVCNTQKYVLNGGFRNTFGLGKSRVLLPVKLPPNTIKWYYEFSAYQNEADLNRVANSFELASELARIIDATGITGNILSMVSQPPGQAYCDVFVMNSWNAVDFENHDAYRYQRNPSRENFTSGVVEVDHCNSGTWYLGFRNPSTAYPINIAVQVVAVVAEYQKLD